VPGEETAHAHDISAAHNGDIVDAAVKTKSVKIAVIIDELVANAAIASAATEEIVVDELDVRQVQELVRPFDPNIAGCLGAWRKGKTCDQSAERSGSEFFESHLYPPSAWFISVIVRSALIGAFIHLL
jgi:hypothetical protein